jgi:hypothetical protein
MRISGASPGRLRRACVADEVAGRVGGQQDEQSPRRERAPRQNESDQPHRHHRRHVPSEETALGDEADRIEVATLEEEAWVARLEDETAGRALAERFGMDQMLVRERTEGDGEREDEPGHGARAVARPGPPAPRSP